jgi:mono/diheme cytochrome c family protein
MKRNIKWTFSAVIMFGGWSLLGAAGPLTQDGESAPQTLPDGVTAAMVTAGEALFAKEGACYTCHGPEGAGTGLAPNLADATWLHIDGSFPALVTLITDGVAQPKESMIPMLPKGGAQIADDQIAAIAAYVWSISHK